mmetsp:Transcript_17259/g.54933  ORF Transcript_17259/g.54933 Transcript_17259/m.54933 type:complete len:96 (+) Transcript_17259:828-1115(+)
MMHMLEHLEVPYTIVLTKCDRLSKAQLDETVTTVMKDLVSENYTHCSARVLGVSVKGAGIQPHLDRLRAEILQIGDSHFHRRKVSTDRVVHPRRR